MASEGVSPAQWRAFTAAWLGWAFDGLDGFLYTLVAFPFVKELLGPGAAQSEIVTKAALIQALFLVGWAFGGAIFGRVGDHLGRSRTLSLTIITYAVFTGMSFFAQAWWHLLIFRFVAALGIGGEWAAGSALVSETLHARHRAWASALLQSGYMTGMILAALTVGWMGSLPSHRFVFLVGVLPALATFWIRRAVPEPQEWRDAKKDRAVPKLSELFSPEVRRTTLLTLSLTSICLTTIWAFLYFNNQVLRGLPGVKLLSKQLQDELVMRVTVTYTIWNIVGNFVISYIAKFIGYRKAFALSLTSAFLCFFIGYGSAKDLGATTLWFNATMFFGTGVFAIFPLYIPPLFPTLLRTTGAGFCYNFGRIVAAIGALTGGLIAAKAGSPNLAIWYAGFLYLPGIILSLFMPELERASNIIEPAYSQT